ncbi:MAG: 6-carboxyhexanoate--CoA ligase [Thermodesulfovibrionia bacterium]|nr:6-carboxyhexanoate--CoA ligase [Thermodesulfovibrionia bacterium]
MSSSPYYSIRMRASKQGSHISGAEGLYIKEDIDKVVKKYSARALSHERGRPDEICISIDKVKCDVETIPSLPLCTMNSLNSHSAKDAAAVILSSSGISENAVVTAFNMLTSGEVKAGAFLLDKEGRHLMDNGKSVRASRMGITNTAFRSLSARLGRLGINNATVREALILASKVQHHPGIIAELCISDDPGYTTGYVTAAGYGYIRLPHIKKKGADHGGRVFFVDGVKTKELILYLQSMPVIINKIMRCRGIVTISDILSNH